MKRGAGAAHHAASGGADWWSGRIRTNECVCGMECVDVAEADDSDSASSGSGGGSAPGGAALALQMLGTAAGGDQFDDDSDDQPADQPIDRGTGRTSQIHDKYCKHFNHPRK